VQVDDEAALYAGSFENDSGLIKGIDLSRPAGLRAALGEKGISDAEGYENKRRNPKGQSFHEILSRQLGGIGITLS
jgi:hypothetical protein